MPRGVKGSGTSKPSKSYDDRITKLDEQIALAETKLKELKDKRKELVQEKEKSELEAIQKVIQEKGITADQLKALIESQNKD